MEKTITTKNGLRKFIPQPERYAARYGIFTLTPRDLDIIERVWRYRHLTTDHIRALTPGSDQQITRRLQGLFHNLYLARYAPRERMRHDLNAGSPVLAYGLETTGWRALQDHGRARTDADLENSELEQAAPDAWRQVYTRRTSYFLEHHLGVSNFHCVLELALRDGAARGLSLLEWDQSKAIRGKVTLRGGKVYRTAPDAYFSIKDAEDRVRNCFLEYDASSEERRRILEKYIRYWWWVQSPAYRDGHQDHEHVAVLFVTTGEKRLANLMQVLREMQKPNNPPFGGKGIFAFALESDYQLAAPASILAPIWRTVTKPKERIALV
ncbi:MAG: replication-relaxation family protein [Acidobacteriia bacterium]|nr:replication-relaxation family protein [Terriglobia bacterium]